MKTNLLAASVLSTILYFNCGPTIDAGSSSGGGENPGGSTGSGNGGGFGFGGGAVGPKNKVGGKCTVDADCDKGAHCDTQMPGGFCFSLCKAAGASVADPKQCPQGSTCDEDSGLCFNACTLGSTCSRSDATCAQVFSTVTTCVPHPLPIHLFVGERCETSTQCGPKGICDTKLPAGYCTAHCQVDADCGYGTCIVFTGADQTKANFCVNSCDRPGSISNCRTGYFCTPVNGSLRCICLPQ